MNWTNQDVYFITHNNMFERLYKFMQFLDRHKEKHNTIEMEQDLFDFCLKIGFVSEDGIINFNGKTFILA